MTANSRPSKEEKKHRKRRQMNRGTELGAVEPTHPQGFLQQQMEKGTIQRTFWRVERRQKATNRQESELFNSLRKLQGLGCT